MESEASLQMVTGRHTRHFEPSLPALGSKPIREYLFDKQSSMDRGDLGLLGTYIQSLRVSCLYQDHNVSLSDSYHTLYANFRVEMLKIHSSCQSALM